MSDRTIIRPGGRKPRKSPGERPEEQESISKPVLRPSAPEPRRQSSSHDQVNTETYQPSSRPRQQPIHSSPPKASGREEYKSRRPETSINVSDVAAINPVVEVTSPLLNVIGRVQSVTAYPNLDELKTFAVSEIDRCESLQFGLNEEETDLINYSSFALCCLIDELVLSTPWGVSSDWEAESLLMRFHGESSGDDRFFEHLEEIMQNPSANRNVLEFYAICLELGFEGKYQYDTSSSRSSVNRELAELRERLFNLVSWQELNSDLPLSIAWQGLQDERSKLVRFVPYWVMLAVTAGSLLLVFMAFSFLISRYSDPLYRHLTSITNSTEVLSVQPANLNSLRSLPLAINPSVQKRSVDHSPMLRSALAGEVNMGLVELVDLSDRIIIRLKQVDLFRSGSEKISQRHVPLIRKIGQVLREITQSVTVTGHTDDVPIRHLRYSSNWDLSKARADSVKAILIINSDLGMRIRSQGLADTFNIVPNNSRENRARNRRVEIVVRK